RGPSRADHQARPADVGQAAGGVRLVHAALQRVGPSGVPAIDARRQDAQETSDRGRGEEVAGAVLGDAAWGRGVARPADQAETETAAVQTASSGRGPAKSRSQGAGEATRGAGVAGNAVTEGCH